MAAVTTEIRDDIAVVHIDNPPVNALSHDVRSGLFDAVNSLDKNAQVKAVILICKGRTFIAGADIREFGEPIVEPHLPQLVDKIENSAKIWIAAIHGTALGGGLEVALGCHYRLAVPSAKVGLPEVNLGLIPGAGGTVRLPRLINTVDAVEIVSTGRPISSEKALKLGILDKITAGDDLLAEALEFANSISGLAQPEKLSERSPMTRPSDSEWDAIISAITKKSKGQQSPVDAALAIRQATELDAKNAFNAERQRFIKLRDSEQSRALRYMFFAERSTTKISRLKDVSPSPINECGVLGGGTMGSGIAASMLLSGKPVTLVERDNNALSAGIDRVEAILKAAMKRRLIDENKFNQLCSILTGSISYDAFANCDIVVEAVFEDMAVKREVFQNLEAVAKKDAILATNTSYLDINEIAALVKQPGRVVGLHFFSPAHIMKLLEIVVADKTTIQTQATAISFAKTLRKIPVISGVGEGFIANRIMSAYRKECDYMLEDGCSPRQIDNAMKGYGMPMGMYEMADMAGLDIGWATRKRLAPARDPRERYVAIADRLCELGRFGQKSSKGWYIYEEGSRTGKDDPLVQQIIEEESDLRGISRRVFQSSEIIERILAAMTSEANSLLKEGIALRSADIDVAMVYGFGFPRWRGGPMFISESAMSA